MLKALRRMINKYVNIKFTSLYSTRMKPRSTRARLDQPVNRIEFNRLNSLVESGLGDGASGAPEPTPEKKNRSKRSGTKDTHLRSSPKSPPVAAAARRVLAALGWRDRFLEDDCLVFLIMIGWIAD